MQPTNKDPGREQIKAGAELPNGNYFSNQQRFFAVNSSVYLAPLYQSEFQIKGPFILQ